MTDDHEDYFVRDLNFLRDLIDFAIGFLFSSVNIRHQMADSIYRFELTQYFVLRAGLWLKHDMIIKIALFMIY